MFTYRQTDFYLSNIGSDWQVTIPDLEIFDKKLNSKKFPAALEETQKLITKKKP